MTIRKNDSVIVIAGKEKGKRGKVHRVIPKDGKLLVEGVNIAKRHMKPRGIARQAGIIEKEAPIDISNVMLVCTKCNRPTRIGAAFSDGASKGRMCRSCGEIID
ncbi:MAG: 50S ribosomal protein L24 [Dehalococcoidia bacterium]|nr:50S ribosomal protein L24 [Dehalococcoidia bacterium]